MSSSSAVKPLWEYAKDGNLDDVKSLTSSVEGAAKIHNEKDEVSDWYSYSYGLGESSVSLLSILLLLFSTSLLVFFHWDILKAEKTLPQNADTFLFVTLMPRLAKLHFIGPVTTVI